MVTPNALSQLSYEGKRIHLLYTEDSCRKNVLVIVCSFSQSPTGKLLNIKARILHNPHCCTSALIAPRCPRKPQSLCIIPYRRWWVEGILRTEEKKSLLSLFSHLPVNLFIQVQRDVFHTGFSDGLFLTSTLLCHTVLLALWECVMFKGVLV